MEQRFEVKYTYGAAKVLCCDSIVCGVGVLYGVHGRQKAKELERKTDWKLIQYAKIMKSMG